MNQRPKNFVAFFSAALAGLGGMFTSAGTAYDSRSKAKSYTRSDRRQQRFGRYARHVATQTHYFDGHGSLRRITPKRDKSISARQWRKARVRAVRAAKATGTAAGE